MLYFPEFWFYQILGTSTQTWKGGNTEIAILCYDKVSQKIITTSSGNRTYSKGMSRIFISLFPVRIILWWATGYRNLGYCPTVPLQMQVPDSFLNFACIFAALVTGLGRATKVRYFSVPMPQVAGWCFGIIKWMIFILSRMPDPSSWAGCFPSSFSHIIQGRQHVKLGYWLCFNGKSWK